MRPIAQPATAFPLVDEALVRRIERAAIHFTEKRLEATLQRPGNPRGMRIERFGHVLAVATPSIPEVNFMNGVWGLRPTDVESINEILAFYRDAGVRPWFELLPSPDFEKLAAALTAAGAAQVGFHGALYGLPSESAATDLDRVEVRGLRPKEMATYADIHLAGHGVEPEYRDEAKLDLAKWDSIEGWRLYLALIDNQPAAAATLSIGDGLGYLANAATLPEHRGRGCHSELIGRRIADAAKAGCDLIASLASFGSISQNNMERAGMRIAYTAAIWRLGAG